MSFGLLVIRLAIGLTMAAHGAQKLGPWLGGHGLDGTAAGMEHMGFRPGRRAAEMAGGSELAGGLGLAVGLLTPLAAAAVVGVMAVAGAAAHGKNGFFAQKGGWEYTFVLGSVAAGLAFTGPGRASFDDALGLHLDGAIWGLLALVLGLGAAAAQLLTRHHQVDLTEAPAAPATDSTAAMEVDELTDGGAGGAESGAGEEPRSGSAPGRGTPTSASPARPATPPRAASADPTRPLPGGEVHDGRAPADGGGDAARRAEAAAEARRLDSR